MMTDDESEVSNRVANEDAEDPSVVHYVSCYVCNGFYGPCFDEPVCTTCHSFLFPDASNEKMEDGDSGNDEPYDTNHSSSSHPNALRLSLCWNNATDTGSHQSRIPPSQCQASEESSESNLVENLPPEVLLAVFSYLDDVSLWSVGNVCRRWRHVLMSHCPDDVWRSYTKRRFPIYKPYFTVKNWFNVYTKLVNSCPCKACFLQMALKMEPHGEESSWRQIRLKDELSSLKSDLPQGIEAVPLDPKCCHWQASITGPVGSPYEGGLFYLYLLVPLSYPMQPPTVKFITRIFHPNVSRHGDVGIDSIRHNWTLALTISKVLISVQSLLTDPYCEVCMEPGIGRLYQEDREAFVNIAREWTWKYAMHDILSS